MNKERFTITPSAIGGSIIAASVLGWLFGPLGAIVGVFAGGIAGQIFDLRQRNA